MPTQFYINPEQDVIAVIHRLLSVSSRRVILNIPPNAKITQDAISLKILKREAQEMAKEIMVVSLDPNALKLAREAGLNIYNSRFHLKAKKTKKPKSVFPTRLKGSVKNRAKSASFLEFISGKKQIAKKDIKKQQKSRRAFKKLAKFKKQVSKQEKKHYQAKGIKRFLYVFLIICFLAAAAVAYLVLPQAKIEVLPKQENLNFELSLVVDAAVRRVDLSLNKIPGQLISVSLDKEQEFATSGEREVDSKAKGTLRIYNNFNTQEQVLVATTRFIPENSNLIFRLLERVVVPPAKIENSVFKPSFIEVLVEADEPGAEYNIAPATFKIPGFLGSPKYEGFYAQSLEPMAGGSKGYTKVVSQEDINQAKESLRATLQDATAADLKTKIPEHLKFLDQCQRRQLISLEANTQPDNPQESFQVKGEIKIEAIVFKLDDIRDLIEQNISAQITDDKHSLAASQAIEYLDCQLSPDQPLAQLKIRVQEKIAYIIDEDKLAPDLLSLNEGQLEEYFNKQTTIDRVRVSFWPFWVKRVPKQKQGFELNVVDDLD